MGPHFCSQQQTDLKKNPLIVQGKPPYSLHHHFPLRGGEEGLPEGKSVFCCLNSGPYLGG